jgi:murein DD-endopeptidase MepM/ murein hydrolase activator NlpD
LQTEININLDDENDKSIKKILLKIDDSRYLQVINDNNTYKVDKIFQDKLNIQSLDLKPISTENLQNISLKNNNLQNTIPIELKDYKIITKTIKINDNIQFLKNIPIQQLVNFKQTNGKTKTQNLTLTTLLHKTKEKNEILFFSISNGNKSIKYYGQKNKNGSISYFTKNGVSAHTVSNFGFPINSSYKISSTFGMRYHPILFYKRMHTGIDIRAKHGTPIFAPSDGKIEFIGSKSGYGKYIILKHNEKYKSAYGHLSSFGNGLKVGSYVKRGQIIGKVGATGMASGPHLHYEIMEKNKFVNPLKVNFSQNITLDKRSMKTFTPNVKNIDSVMHKIDTINKNNVKIA